jgi:uncharacterized membrane protein
MNPVIAALSFDGIGTSPVSVTLWIAGIVFAAAFLVWTYWGIFRRSERNLAWGLFALRAGGLLLLALTLAKPSWVSRRSAEEPARVAVILDDSASMSLSDSGGPTRYEQAKQALDRLRAALENRHGKKVAVDVYDILGNELPSGPKPEAAAEQTNLAAAVATTFGRAKGRPLAGIVLISDGADNRGRVNLGGLGDLRQRDAQVGVFAAGFPKPDDPSVLDFAVGKPNAPEEARVNNTVAVEVPVTKAGGPAAEATVALKLGGETLLTKKVSFPKGPGRQTVRLDYTPANLGSFHYTVAVATDLQESVLTNNAEAFDMAVFGEPIKVFYLEGAMRWEYRYLKERLEQDPDVNLRTVLRRLSPDRPAAKPGKELLSAETLKDVDVLILGDIEGKFLSASEYAAILAWLDGKNHALLVLGGYTSFGPEGWAETPLAKALPVVFAASEPYQKEGAFVPLLTDEGKRHPAFQFAAGPAAADLWTESAKLDGLCLVQRAKPGASVLAVHPELKINGEPAVVACWQNYGAGKTMVLTADTTWHWSRIAKLIGKEDTVYRRFWGQTVRWLAGRGTDDRRPLLKVSTDRTGYAPGQTVEIRVTRLPRPDLDLTGVEWSAELRSGGTALTDANGKQLALPLKASLTAPDEFTATVNAPPGGRYEVAVKLTKDGKPLANQSAEFLVQGTSLELADPTPRPENLRAIAAATGGVAVEVGQEERLAEQLPVKPRYREWDDRREFWNSPALFVLFLVLVSAEWFIRRRNQMV